MSRMCAKVILRPNAVHAVGNTSQKESSENIEHIEEKTLHWLTPGRLSRPRGALPPLCSSSMRVLRKSERSLRRVSLVLKNSA
jgi:hypothetical protein